MSDGPIDPPGAIRLEGGDALTDGSVEIARVWVTDGGSSSVWINPHPLEEPEVFGFLLADVFHHAARAYAGAHGLSVDAAAAAIRAGFDAMAGDPDDMMHTLNPGGRIN